MQIQKHIPPKPEAALGMATASIPALIHQTFETTDIADRMHEAAMSWVRHNPGFAYHFHDNVDRRHLIETQFEPHVLAAYDQIDNGAFRADLWRYCQLYTTGGVYADIDQVCKMPLSQLLLPEDDFLAARAGNLPFAVYNGFICARPGHPFLKAAIDRAVDLIARTPDGFDGYMTTGPWNLGVAVNQSLGHRQKRPHQIGLTQRRGHRLRLLEKHPKSPQAPGYLTLDEKVVLLTEYPDYREDLKTVGVTHWNDTRAKRSLPHRLWRKLKALTRHLGGR